MPSWNATISILGLAAWAWHMAPTSSILTHSDVESPCRPSHSFPPLLTTTPLSTVSFPVRLKFGHLLMAPHITLSSLPDAAQPEMNFYDTSFFQHDTSRQLPSPQLVLERLLGHTRGAVIFEDLGLIVKCSPELMFEEAQTMRAINYAFPQGEIPVPEIFGWRRYGEHRFIYMSLIEGMTMYEAWPSLTEEDKEKICVELRSVISSLHQITRDPTDDLICSINGGKLQDRFFQFDDADGPFSSIQSFNNFFLAVATRQTPQLEGYMDGPYRDFFPDSGNIYFTHGDLTPTNVIVSGEPGSYSLKGIIDWEQAGWYPEYWEYCKLLIGTHYEHEWRKAAWVDKLMTRFEDEWNAYVQYSLWRNP